jgi:hypothetical protein
MTPNSGGGGKRVWKSFEHYKSSSAEPGSHTGMDLRFDYWGFPPHIAFRRVNDPYIGYFQYFNNSEFAPFGDPGNPSDGLPGFVVDRSDGGFVPAPDNLEMLVANSLRSMLPIVKAELSLINSIIELKDFRAPVRHACALLRKGGVKTLYRKGKGLVKRGLTLGQVIRGAAEGYLQLSFNILPLISDVRAIYRAASRTERRINDLINRSGRSQNKHWMFRWQEYPDCVSMSPSHYGWVDTLSCEQQLFAERSVKYSSTAFHAQIQYDYNYTELQMALSPLLAQLDSLGINFNPAIIWNAIPWSFVVDWFAGFSRKLDSMKMENMKPKINIHRYLWSVRRERVIAVTKGIWYDSTGRYKTQNQLPLVYQTAYRRSVDMPPASSLETSGLSLNELSLGAALAVTRRRHRRHWL